MHRYHEQFGHTVMHLHAEPSGLLPAQHRATLELFQAEVAPILRRDIPDPPWPWEPVVEKVPAGVASASAGVASASAGVASASAGVASASAGATAAAGGGR